MPELFTKTGQPTNAIYGFIRMILKVNKKFNPQKLIVAFDAPGGSKRRQEKHEAYKIHRQPMPDNLRAQRQPLDEVLQLMGVPVLKMEGVEADDTIAKLVESVQACKLSRLAGLQADETECLIISSDKDLLQFVDGGVKVYDPSKDIFIGEKEVEEKWGIKPTQIKDLLALMGDASDGIPGVPGVGEKTAVKLLQEYGSLQNVLDNADKIKGKLGEKISANKEIALLSYELASPHLDMDIGFDKIEDFQLQITDQLIAKLKELELVSVVRELEASSEIPLRSLEPRLPDGQVRRIDIDSLDGKNEKNEIAILNIGDDVYISDGTTVQKEKLDKLDLGKQKDVITFDYKELLKKQQAVGSSKEESGQISMF
jgi:DNA polymerase-1